MNCEVCGWELTMGVASYSERVTGLHLCLEHQHLYREICGYDDKPEEVLARMKKVYQKN